MAGSTSDRNREDLRDAISKKAAELRSIDQHRACTQHELRRLNEELESLEDRTAGSLNREAVHEGDVPSTPAQKIALFRSLFRGREDVYPKFWTNIGTGRSGYAPACENEWVRGICEKPRVKCGDCRHQRFLPVQDRVLLDHFQGRHVVGVYPLLADDTCWLLAADFDKRDWMGDVAAFREACDSEGLPVAVERSRSGEGAHAWFFFDRALPAVQARQMGCFLITKAMRRRHTLDVGSYDRLFPSQDTLPRGGFGNLIALPLQREARLRGNTVFVDREFRAHPDQWAYIAGVRRIPAATVEQIASEAVGRGCVLSVRRYGRSQQGSTARHLAESSAAPRNGVHEQVPPPEQVRATLANGLHVDKKGLPSPILSAIKRVASFQNPEFYKRQRMRLSTALTPRVIACAEDLEAEVVLPRGCAEDVSALLRSMGTRLEVKDLRERGRELDVEFQGTLRGFQEDAVAALLANDTGVLVAPPGTGKTVMGIALIARRGRSTLVLVHRQPLLDQWRAHLAAFLDVDPKSIGCLGGGKRTLTGLIDVAMIQSLVRGDKAADLMDRYGHVLVDECHHVPAFSFERVVARSQARYLTGLTASPRRRDGLHPILEMQLGPARFGADGASVSIRPSFARRLVVRETGFELPSSEASLPIHRIYKSLACDEHRNSMILNDIIGVLDAGRSPMVLTERRHHLESLAERLTGFAKNLIVLRGGVSAKQRATMLQALKDVPDEEERLVLATGRYIGEGFDDPRLDTLFLTMPVSWRGTIVQYAGRLHRMHPGKQEVRIFDYADRRVPILARMFAKRVAGYRSLGYKDIGGLAL